MKLIEQMFLHFSFFQSCSSRGNEAPSSRKLEPPYVGCYGISELHRFLLSMLCAGLAGCASQNTVTPLSNGYEEVAHPTRASVSQPENMRISFQYRGPKGRTTLIWPSLYGVNEVVKGDLAIFVGDEAYVSPNPDDPRGVKPRLFAVRSPGLPVDITDEVLQQWAKASGKDFAKARAIFSLVIPEEKNGRLELHLEFWTQARDWPDKTAFQLDWSQVSDIMREVKEKGQVRNDLQWGTSYIEKKSQPEVRQ